MKRQMISQDRAQRLPYIDVILILSGILAPVIWLLAILIVGSHRPEYSHISQVISELGIRDTPFNKVYNFAGLMPAGILTFTFSLVMFRHLEKEIVFYFSSSLVSIVGITRFLAGIFPCDPGCFPVISTTGRLHALFGLISFVASIIAPLVMAMGLRNRNSKVLFYFSIVIGSASLVIFILILSKIFLPFTGFLQRFLLVLTYSWIIAVAVKIKNIEN